MTTTDSGKLLLALTEYCLLNTSIYFVRFAVEINDLYFVIMTISCSTVKVLIVLTVNYTIISSIGSITIFVRCCMIIIRASCLLAVAID